MLILSIVFNLSILPRAVKLEQFYELSMEEEKVKEELLEEEVKDLLAQNQKQTHEAYNQSRRDLIEELESFKSLDELRAEAEAESQDNEEAEGEENPDASVNNDASISADTQKKTLASNDAFNKANEVLKRANSVNRNTTVAYSLKDRDKVGDLPNPIYTCMASGKIVVNITVDSFGDVIGATINEASSTSLDGCLVDKALEYARLARFEKSPKASQIGTITYVFQPK